MKIYNTLSRSIEEFVPVEEGKASMYTCGPTVYHYAHIGNLRKYINDDILMKSLRYLGYDVKRVMNITDVGHLASDADEGEDKMVKGAKRESKTVLEVAEMYTKAFFDDCEKLNIEKPEIIEKATDHIDDYIKIIKGLEEKGYTYFVNGNVYFDISKFPNYTELSKMKLEDLEVASRDDVAEDKNKKNPQDFVLWFTKSKFENQALKWESPWGEGYPGWHIECSAISLNEIGERMDIHTGGVDHIPVHHTNEIAQSEAYLGHKWTNYWVHSEFLNDQTGKMSKSNGEFLTVSLLESKGYNPLDYRFMVLQSHYRKQLVFSYEGLDTAKNALAKLKNKIQEIMKNVNRNSINTENITQYTNQFKEYLSDDLNIANVVTLLFDVVKDEKLNDGEKVYLIEEFDKVLSLNLFKVDVKEVSEGEKDIIEELIQKRNEAKKNKDFTLADSIREELLAMNIAIKDTREGTTWEKI